jgi:undecaprenyl pyrophosphate phosphatase UppP
MAGNPINIISKIGNYALPAFAAFLTASFTIGNLSWSDEKARYLIIAFSLYTIFSVFVAYFHRLLWLRHRNRLKNEGKKAEDLPFSTVLVVLIIHFILIIFLSWIVISYCWF